MIICYFAVCTGVVWDYSFLYTIPFVSIQKHTFAFCFICLLLIDYCCHVMFMNTQRKKGGRRGERQAGREIHEGWMWTGGCMLIVCLAVFTYQIMNESMISLFHCLQLRSLTASPTY